MSYSSPWLLVAGMALVVASLRFPQLVAVLRPAQSRERQRAQRRRFPVPRR